MKKVLLFGSTGSLGKEIVRETIRQGYDLTIVVRNKSKAGQLAGFTQNYIIADITNKSSLIGICGDFDVVISSLGKSVSPNDKSKPSFNDIDFIANSYILEEAKKAGVKKFVYVSAFHSEKYLNLEYFRTHHQFAEKLKTSGINYSIIKPPAIFSSFIDMIEMARKGQLVNMGNGNNKTNPIYEGDLAEICVNSIKELNITIEAGGKSIYTRKELNEIIQKEVNPNKKIKNIPIGFFKFLLPVVKVFNKNTYDKFAFFTAVMQNDTIAPQIGEKKFEDYVKMKVNGS